MTKAFSDELGSIAYSDVLTYIRSAMKGVGPEYTQRSKEAGEKVKDHLRTVLDGITYKYQGSVMTDTHIKGHSDIDLLTITEKFYSWDKTRVEEIVGNHGERQKFWQTDIDKLERKVRNFSAYQGNIYRDLRDVRLKSESKLSEVYLDCDVSKPKSIRITNRSLRRDVDVVTANWYDDVTSIINDFGEYRGVQVYDKDLNQKGSPDYPFTSILRINERSSQTNGRLKKMIRFLKNCKADSLVEVKLSSFDINAICYDIKVDEYRHSAFYELVPVLYRQLKNICQYDSVADNIVSVDGREYIFRGNEPKKNDLRRLLSEVEGVYLDLQENRLLTI